MHAFVIDDSSAIRKILRQYLQSMEIEVTEAQDGQDALDKLNERGSADLFLVDWEMPVMTGIEFVRAVRSEARWQDIPIMMVTSLNELERVIEALEAGANEYVMKPCTQQALQEKLALIGIQADSN
ncbi:MAG: response regulator [Calditrichaeota bacterium]|nr:response regulator [Candidatus Cloacimonadota bacterium]MCA9785833.1 response regulator [Candidatus Cloacimonadota bacterium]MCB1046322.1 response regulator [Calditrichota bacterium]MCB9473869.1 response regulator [Candidatus Delongbacteria bacterium]